MLCDSKMSRLWVGGCEKLEKGGGGGGLMVFFWGISFEKREKIASRLENLTRRRE